MTRTRFCLIAVPVLVAASLQLGHRPLRADRTSRRVGSRNEAACSVCHPGSLKSLRRSMHAGLVDAEKPDASCLSCHDQGMAHQNAPRDPQHAPGSGRAACARCHPGMQADDARAISTSHPTKAQVEALAKTEVDPRTPSRGLELREAADREFGIDGRLRAGWRFVDVGGDERAFDHDFNLDPGPRLANLELRTLLGGSTLVEGAMRGLEDREFTARAATGEGLSRLVGASGSFRRNLYVYDAEGDYHTLSNTREWTNASMWFAPGEGDARWTFDYDRLDSKGRTISSRIGNANQNPLVPATGVPVDRRLESDVVRLSFEDRLFSGSWSAELAWEETRSRDDLRYSRPSPANTSFTESETSSSRASQRGPEGTVRFAFGDDETTQLQLTAIVTQLDTRYGEDAFLTAFDTSAFTTDTLGVGSGDRRRIAFAARLAQPLTSSTRLSLEADWIDVRDHSRMTIDTTTTRTSTSLVVRSQQNLDLLTRVRDQEFRAALEQSLGDGFDIELGWRYLDQYLLFPDLELNDNDYRAGSVYASGPEAAALWKPNEDWLLRARYALATTGSRTPTETQPEVGQLVSGRIRRSFGARDSFFEVFGKWRRAENDVSSTQADTQSYGASLSLAPWEKAQLRASGAWTQIRSETLTNFYFSPSTSPVPTLVTFRGDSLLLDLELQTPLVGSLESLTLVGLQTTDGSLDSSLLRIDEELSYRVSEKLTVGLQATFIDYDEDRVGPTDNYEARVGFLFAELRF